MDSHYKRIDALTSLRFLAAALIAFQHAGSPSFFRLGISLFDTRHGVSFFFVLSGFILSHAYGNMRAGDGLREFWAARIARLWPAHAATAVLAMLAIVPIADVESGLKALVNLFLLQSWIPLKGWYYSVNAVSWSISTELFFYVAFPLVLPIARERPLGVAVFSIALVGVLIAVVSIAELSPAETSPGVTAWGMLYVSPVARFAEFLGGMVAYRVAIDMASRASKWSTARASWYEAAAAAMTFAAMVGCTKLAEQLSVAAPQASVWIRIAGPYWAFGMLLVVLYAQRGALTRLLSWRPLVYLGEISFALYLLHQLVLRWMFAHYRDFIEANWLISYGAYWAISIIGATAIYHWVEQPSRPALRAALTGSRRRRLA
ncbi:acyltransferase family protein [Cupriavidus gilardii]|uniref:acyltransferase family protein n=1 Tax=Cupriavidus gilardii TaxID=82541 RepID=UPI0007E4D142|nr:acyltransferase [Cupriavidus gilardii]